MLVPDRGFRTDKCIISRFAYNNLSTPFVAGPCFRVEVFICHCDSLNDDVDQNGKICLCYDGAIARRSLDDAPYFLRVSSIISDTV